MMALASKIMLWLNFNDISSIVGSIIAHETRIEDYLLSDKQSDKAFLWEISLMVREDFP